MKKLKLNYLFVLIFLLGLLAGCGDDEEKQVSGFVGKFIISHADVAAPFNIATSTGMQIPVPVGTDITQAIQTALLGSVKCSSADKSWVELREDNSIYMSCEGTNAFNAGTWQEVSSTQLKLNMNSTAIPSSPTGIVLDVSGIVQKSTGWTGKTTVPMPKEMFAPVLAGFGMTVADNPAVYMVTFSLDFVKK